jgi:hypothetical protein
MSFSTEDRGRGVLDGVASAKEAGTEDVIVWDVKVVAMVLAMERSPQCPIVGGDQGLNAMRKGSGLPQHIYVVCEEMLSGELPCGCVDLSGDMSRLAEA